MIKFLHTADIHLGKTFALFTDVSVNPQRKLGIGGYLLVPMSFLDSEPDNIKRDEVSSQLKTRLFNDTSSTKLEVQTLLWALENFQEEFPGAAFGCLQIYTDSQCIEGLAIRRARLIDSNFVASGSGRELKNAMLYRRFYEACDQLGFKVNKVAGHSPVNTHTSVQRIFSYVDRDVRKALSLWLDSQASLLLPG